MADARFSVIRVIGAELDAAGDLVTGLTPDADVAMLYSTPSKWALECQPPFADHDGGPDPRSYEGIFDPFYRGAFDAGLQVRVLHPGQATSDAPAAFADRHRVLVVPGLYIADDATLDWLAAYAAAGGHLVLGPRTAYADLEARARTDRMPARLTAAAGTWYDEYSNLWADLPVHTAPDSPVALPPDATATRWVDGLQPDGAQVLARDQHPHFGRWPAATTHTHGTGRVTVIGTEPNTSFAAALFGWLLPMPGDGWRATPATVTSTGATARNGRRLRFLHNWSWEPATFPLPEPVRDLLAGTDHPAGEPLPLGPWDVRVLLR